MVGTNLVRAHSTAETSATLGCLAPLLASGTHSISQLQTKGFSDKKTSGCALPASNNEGTGLNKNIEVWN